MTKTKQELDQYFKEYTEYLIKNNLELEFNKLIFIKKENALQELDKLQNYKRPYLRNLIKEIISTYSAFTNVDEIAR